MQLEPAEIIVIYIRGLEMFDSKGSFALALVGLYLFVWSDMDYSPMAKLILSLLLVEIVYHRIIQTFVYYL